MIPRLGLVLLMAAFPRHDAADPFIYTWSEIAPGVHVGVRENSPRFPVMGTATFVVSEEGVVVFDGGGVPLMSERALEKIRSVTDRPVTHVVVSHWHQDHNWGIRTFVDTFPDLRIVAHPYTRDALQQRDADAVERVRTVVERQLPGVIEQLDGGELAAGDRARLETFVADAAVIEREYQRLEPAHPTLTFEERMVIHSGSRRIELLHLGKGNTAGDVVMWLPEERIVATGDLVVRPTPYGFGSYPREWAETLRRLSALDFRVLVPGHGELQHDARYVNLLIETLELVADQMQVLVAEGLDEDTAVARLDFSAVEERFTRGDEFLAGRFRVWFKEPIARAAHRIARGESPE